jgi:predicted TIM-barrel fold metal-dependent hydrolase
MSTQTLTASAKRSYKDYLKGVKVVDTDTHITEWPDLWTSRAPAKFKDRVPSIKTINGKRYWMIDDHELFFDSGASAIVKDGSKIPGLDFFEFSFDQVHPASHDVKARLAYMDEMGIAAQIGYPNLLGFGGRKAMMVDAELRLVSMQILNDAYAEMQEASNNRVYPMAMIPWWDMKLAVAEAKRCADMGLRGINTHSNPEAHGIPDLGNSHWDPLWDVCEERNLPVNFHIGFSEGATAWLNANPWGHDANRSYVASTVMLFAGNTHVMANMLLSKAFDRHPGLKMVSVESAVGWVPFLIEHMDYQLAETEGFAADDRIMEKFKKHYYICGWFEKKGMVDAIHRLGADNVLFETDFPHPTCLYPDPLEYLVPTLKQLTPEENKKVFETNAVKLYNLDLSKAPAI